MGLCALCAALGLATPAQADVMTYLGTGLNQAVTLHAPGHLANGQVVHAGQYRISYQGETYTSWCVDLDQYTGTVSVTERSYLTLQNPSAVAYLFETYADSSMTSTEAAALAVSFWEVLTEPVGGPFSASSGNFWVTNNSAVAARAATMLASIPSSYTPTEDLVVLYSSTKQDMLIGRPGSGAPEPATLALVAGGAIALLGRKCRPGR